MTPWVESAIVVVVVGVAVVWAIRAIWRSTRKGQVCSSCSDSGSCPVAGKKPDLIQLQDFNSKS